MKRLVIFVLVVFTLWTAENLWLKSRQREISTTNAAMQVDNVAASAAQLRQFKTFKGTLQDTAAVLTLVAAFLCFDSLVRSNLGIVRRSC